MSGFNMDQDMRSAGSIVMGGAFATRFVASLVSLSRDNLANHHHNAF
jgi:hypothetical protein